MREREKYTWTDLFIGDWQVFTKVVSNPETIIVWDIDGVLGNTPRPVFSNVFIEHGLHAHPSQISSWDYLSSLARDKSFSEDKIIAIENGWYSSDILEKAPRNLYMKRLVDLTTSYYGVDRNYVLTSRKPHLKEGTYRWMEREYPQISSKNILIRGSNEIKETEFKSDHIKRLSKQAPYVVFIDDSTKYIQHVLDQSINNCFVINTPLGVIDFKPNNDHAFVIKRYPHNLQAMLPLLDAFRSALSLI